MNNDERDHLLAELATERALRADILHRTGLNESDREGAEAIIKTADLLWLAAHGAPALEDDPAAALLGLVADPTCSLDSKALARLRKRAALTVTQVAERLAARGWQFQTGDVFRWESRTAAQVPPAVISALAEILGTQVESLTKSLGEGADGTYVTEVRRHPVFRQLTDRWARAQGVSLTVAASALERRMLATVHRGQRPDAEQLLASLQELVSSVEHPGDDAKD